MNPNLANVSESIRRLNPDLYGAPAGSCPQPMKSEADLHNAIMDECRARGWIFLHGSMAERTHRTAGEPDFIILASGGRTFFVECKSATGKLSPDQQAMRSHAAKLGHTIHIIRSTEEFLKAVT